MSQRVVDVVVIGGGANGLIAAARLGKAGRRVLLLERDGALGGQGRVIEFAPGFRAAPLGTEPGWLPAAIARGLALDGLEHDTRDTAFTVMAEPGSFLTLSRDVGRASEAIRSFSPGDASKWPSFTAQIAKLAGFLEALYLTDAPDISTNSLRDLLPLIQLGRKYRALGRRDMIEFLRTLPLSIWELLDDWFESAPLKAGVATGGIQDHQQGPRSGGTGFVLLHHLVGAPAGSVRGRTPWRAGPAAFTRAAEGAARRFGVSIRTGASVARIKIRDDAVVGIALADGEEIETGIVLSTADPSRTLLDWVDPVWLDPEFVHAVGNIRHRGCTAVVLYGLDAPPELSGHVPQGVLSGLVSLTPCLASLEKAADAAKYGAVSEHPHVEFTVPTLLWPDLADQGMHVLVARAQYAPYELRDGATWDSVRRDALAESVTAAIDVAAPGFRSRIRHCVALSPRDLEDRYALHEGAATHGELGLDQILFMRPVPGWGRYAMPVRGLYLGGAGTHPGPGILGGAGWLAAGRILHDRRRASSHP